MANTLLTSFVTALGTALPSMVAAANPFSSHASANAKIEAYIQDIYAFVNDPEQVKTAAAGIAQVADRPLQATMAAMQIRQNAANPAMVLQLAAGLHQYLQSQNSNILTSILSSAPAS